MGILSLDNPIQSLKAPAVPLLLGNLSLYLLPGVWNKENRIGRASGFYLF